MIKPLNCRSFCQLCDLMVTSEAKSRLKKDLMFSWKKCPDWCVVVYFTKHHHNIQHYFIWQRRWQLDQFSFYIYMMRNLSMFYFGKTIAANISICLSRRPKDGFYLLLRV